MTVTLAAATTNDAVDLGYHKAGIGQITGVVWNDRNGNQAQSGADEIGLALFVLAVALIADAIRDCSRRGEIVLDGFGGSGSTLIAAEKTGRSASR